MDGAGSPQGLREDLLALAGDTLLDHLACADARAALAGLIDRLVRRCGAPLLLVATDDRGQARWQLGAPIDGGTTLPLQHREQRVGALVTSADAATLEPVLPVIAALLAAEAQAAAGVDDPSELDTSTRHAIASAAAMATERLERIARHVPGVLYTFVMKPDGRTGFDYASERIREFFGVPVAQATGRFANIFALVEAEDRQRVAETAIDSARRLVEWQQDFRVRRADGALRWFRASSTPRREPDGSTVWYGYMQDVTDQHALLAAQRQAEVAAAANKAKTEFLSRMSHELRTPLNAVLGFTQLMEIDRAEPPTEGQRRRLKLIREAGDHLLRMIGDLLDLTRIEQGGMALTLEPVALRPLVADCVGLLQPSADAAQVRIELPPGPDVRVLADRTRLQQVLMNLLSNAIKYNRPGGRVDLEIRCSDGTVVLVVRDSGLGIEQDVLPRLFEPFYRGAQARGSIEGTGIGLSLTRSLVLLMNGSIEVDSEPGVGSTFTVTLPEAAAQAAADPSAEDPP